MSLTIGQTLYYRRNRSNEIVSCKVSDIKRKYFFVDKEFNTKFQISDLRHYSNHSSAWDIQLYLTQEEILKGDRDMKLKQTVNDRFRYGTNPTMEQYEAIAKILNIEI